MGIISTVKKFIYAIAILLALSSLAVALGYIFIDAIPIFETADIVVLLERISFFATVMLVTECIIMPLVMVLGITNLSSYVPYYILCIIGIGLYIFACYSAPALSGITL